MLFEDQQSKNVIELRPLKVMANQKVSGARCYGYVTMASVSDAERCIEKLNKTEIHGNCITVEKASSVSLPGVLLITFGAQNSTQLQEQF